MVKTHIILVGFGDVGTKIYPALMKIREEENQVEHDSICISIVDILPWNKMLETIKPKLWARFKDHNGNRYNEKDHFDFLIKNYFQDLEPENKGSIPEGLIERIRSERTIVYLALDPDIYMLALQKYLPLGNIFAIEKPLAKDRDTAADIVTYAKENENLLDNKRYIPIDHYLGKDAFNLFDIISKMDRFRDIINDSNLIAFSFLEKDIIPPTVHPYFASTGIIADMMPHVSALLKKILKSKFKLKPQQVGSSVLDSYKEQCIAAGLSYKETYAEIQMALYGDKVPNKTVIVRIGKGMPLEDRTVAFVNDSTHNMLLMKLPHKDLTKGEVLLNSTGDIIKVEHEKITSEIWDKSWYNILRGLMDQKFDQFLTIEDAQEIVEMIGEIKEKNDEYGKLDIYDRVTSKENELPHYLEFDWKHYNLHSNTDYAVIFNLNGVLIDNRDLNKNVWKLVLEQLRIKGCSDDLLYSLISSGLLTKEILIYILGKYYKSFRNGSEVEIFASIWAKKKEEQYLRGIIDNYAHEMRGATQLLTALTNNEIRIGLYSILSEDHVFEILDKLDGVKQYFNVIVTPEMIRRDYHNQNTFMGCLNEIISRLNIDKKKCFLLEDSAMCVDMAKKQGVECIGFGMENRKVLKDRGAICVVNDHNSLLSIFEGTLKYDEVVEKLKKLDEQIQ